MIKFNNVSEIKCDNNNGKYKKYLAYINGEEIVSLFKEGKITYNPEIQRGYEVKKIGKELVEIPIKNEKKVDNIFKDMEKGKFFESMLTFNYTDGSEETMVLEEDEYGRFSLAIDKKLDILDGFHRISGLIKLDENSTDYKPINYNFPVEITNLSTSEAQIKFYQLTLSSKISTSRTEYFNHENAANKIVKRLMESALKDKVEISKNIIPKSSPDKLVTFATLSNALKDYTRLETLDSIEIENLTNYLDHFFLELFSLFDGFNSKKVRDVQNKVVITYDNFTFYAYMALALELYSSDCEKGEYGKVTSQIKFIQKLDLERKSEIFKSITKVKVDNNGKTKYVILNNLSTRKTIGIIFIRELKKILRTRNLL